MHLNEQFLHGMVVWFEEMVPFFFENRMISGKFLEPYSLEYIFFRHFAAIFVGLGSSTPWRISGKFGKASATTCGERPG